MFEFLCVLWFLAYVNNVYEIKKLRSEKRELKKEADQYHHGLLTLSRYGDTVMSFYAEEMAGFDGSTPVKLSAVNEFMETYYDGNQDLIQSALSGGESEECSLEQLIERVEAAIP